MDLTLHDVRLADNPGETVDIGIADGRIAAIRPDLPRDGEVIDGEGRLAVPGFCESHIHLDKSCILDRCTMAGGIEDAIAEVGALKAAFTPEDVAERAGRTLEKAVTQGTQRMRTHVEVDPVIGLRGYEGVKAAIAEWAFAIDVEVCVFPQEGMTNNPGTEELMVEVLKDGARVVGATPYTDTDSRAQIDRVFDLARRFDVDIDMHLDFGTDPENLDVEHVARRTEEYGWGGRVAVGHVTRFTALSPAGLTALSRRLADAGVAVTVVPATDLFLMHRGGDVVDPPRGVTPAHLMAAEGVTCSLSTNNVLNPFTPYGDCSLVRMANLYANIAQLGSRPDLCDCLSMVSTSAAKLMNLPNYGILPGNPADIVLLDASDPAMAVAELAPPLLGLKGGRRTFARERVRVFR